MIISAKRLAALRWFAANGPAGLFGGDAPSMAMRKHMLRDGHIEEVGPRKDFEFIRYGLSRCGRELVKMYEGKTLR